LARFFTPEPGGQGYRIHKGIRDLLVFSEQDLIKDPPFSRLDLISCRNLLIYLGADLQKKLTPMFHFALNPTGMLFLGSSEGVGEFDSLFTVLDRKAKLYRRKEDLLDQQRNTLSRFMAPVTAVQASLPSRGAQVAAFAPKLPLRALMEEALLRQIAPASALVNAGGDMVYLHGRTGMYLEPTAGEAGIQNILKMAREGLRPALATALHQAVVSGQTSLAPNIRVKTNGHLHPGQPQRAPGGHCRPWPTHGCAPVPGDAPDVPEAPDPEPAPQSAASSAASRSGAGPAARHRARIAAQGELRAKDEYLQSTHEELESSNEELKSATRKCSRSTRNCNPPTRNWRPPRKNCSRSTKSWPRSTPSCKPR
jgi:two-component system CheB/CheR fusion protein